MTYKHTDADGDRLTIHGMLDDNGRPVVHFGTSSLDGVYVDADRVEEVVAGIRDAARTASGQQPSKHLIVPVCDQCGAPWVTDHTCADPTTADDPTPLRWGLGDILHSDDDTVIVCLSGPAPDRAPYWLELDPERAAALREDLTGPDGQPAEARPANEALTAAERKFLHFALDEAADEMSYGDGFTDDDQAALDRLRLLAGKDER